MNNITLFEFIDDLCYDDVSFIIHMNQKSNVCFIAVISLYLGILNVFFNFFGFNKINLTVI